jgi:hypothetical protein
MVACLGALAPALSADAASTIFYVDNQSSSCDDAGSGTGAEPFCTISAAAAKATAGTMVQVAAGTYTEQVGVKSGASGSPVVFQAAPGATVTVTGGTYGFYVSNKSWVTIRGFTVTNTTSDGFHVPRARTTSS